MEEKVYEALKQIVDPEVGFDIVSLGLIYDVKVKDGIVNIVMTLSSPSCPISDVILGWVEQAVLGIEGVEDINIELSFEPSWNIEMANDDVKKALGII